MNLLVMDASVAVKWFLPRASEPLVDESLGLLRLYASGEIRLLVPDLFWAEFTNILWKATRQSRCTKGAAQAAISAMKGRNLPTVSSKTLLEEAFVIATTFNRSVYDSLYVALAVISSAQMVTADEKLANALAAYLPVKWLGGLRWPIV